MNLINFLGVCTVASTKNTNTDEVFVYAPSLFPMADGGVVAQSEQTKETSTNAHNETVSSNSLRSNTVLAKWRDFGGGARMTSPDVREGSRVVLYKGKGSNEYYWTTWGLNGETYRLETVMYGWQANPNTDENTPFDIDNFYILTVSTHDGKMSLRTSQVNGEKTKFEVVVDAANGKIMIGGKEKNFLVFDDIEHAISYVNAEGSIFQVNKKKITAFSEDSITFNGVESVNVLTKTFNLECKIANFKIGSKWNIECPETAHKGNIKQTGNYHLTGDYGQVGNMNVSYTITANTDVIGGGVSLKNHKTTGVRGGPDISGPPQL